MALQPNLQVFLDLDGVFDDFDARVKRLSWRYPNKLERSQHWKKINHDDSIFDELELIEGCFLFWESNKYLEPVFLTGAPSSKIFLQLMRLWVERIFGPEF